MSWVRNCCCLLLSWVIVAVVDKVGTNYVILLLSTTALVEIGSMYTLQKIPLKRRGKRVNISDMRVKRVVDTLPLAPLLNCLSSHWQSLNRGGA